MPADIEETDLRTLIDRVVTDKERITLALAGREVAALVPIEDLELLDELDDLLELDEIRASRKEAQEKGTVPWDKMKADLGI